MPVITIDGTEYDTDKLSDKANPYWDQSKPVTLKYNSYRRNLL